MREAVSPIVLIKGAGEMASAVAWRLHKANVRRICMTELDNPLCVRRRRWFDAIVGEGYPFARVIGRVVAGQPSIRVEC